jgi:hypothetical protein
MVISLLFVCSIIGLVMFILKTIGNIKDNTSTLDSIGKGCWMALWRAAHEKH